MRGGSSSQEAKEDKHGLGSVSLSNSVVCCTSTMAVSVVAFSLFSTKQTGLTDSPTH